MAEREPLLSVAEAAAMLGLKPHTLDVWACTRRYPLPFVKIGRRRMYRPADVDAFIASRTVAIAK